MIQSLDSKLAEKFGLIEAIFINHLYYLIKENESEVRHLMDNKYWIQKSYAGFAKFFKYLTESQIRYALKKLETKKVIVTMQKDKGFEKYYSFSDLMFKYLGEPRIEVPTTNEDFMKFWNMYDKKVDKVKCEKVWNRMSNKAKEMCFERLPNYIQATPDKQFRRNPLTYLRNKSWKDEIIVKRGVKTNDNKPAVKYKYKNEV